ncbi:MAG: EAL domain-containing protein [Candidatus Eremiobacteraeota bacterium]|nr:EAL domain-containing protein [Candidatus Eremiobacteraeota bacterium]
MRNAEAQASRIGRLYSALSKINRTIFNVPDERGVFQAACDMAVEAGDFLLAWIATPNNGATFLNTTAFAGPALGYLSTIRVSMRADVPEGLGPLGTAMRERRIVVENDFFNSATVGPWLESAREYDLRSLICTPIVCGNRVVAGLGLYAGVPGMFGEQERTLVAQLANDIALAIERLAQSVRLHHEERLRQLVTEVYGLIAADAPLEGVFERLLAVIRERSPENRPSIVTTRGHAPLDFQQTTAQTEACKAALETGAPRSTFDGVALPVAAGQGEVIGALGIFRSEPYVPTDEDMELFKSIAQLASIATERALGRDRLEHQALHDGLTDLPNRLLFDDRLRQARAAARRRGTRVAVGLLDLDRFKVVNDTLGHTAGDELLRAVADRLRAALRVDETIARMGGDEFLLIFTDIKHPSEADVAARRLLGALEPPFYIADRELFVTASLGIVVEERHASVEHGTLLQHADKAMYRAKQSRSGYVLHGGAPAEHGDISELDLENDLHRALARDEFEQYYQPLVDGVTGRVVGAEALIRWNHPKHGILFPDRFIPLAETTGLVVPIGAWTLQKACRQAKAWETAGLDLTMSINVSARQLAQPGLQAAVVAALAKHDLRADAICLEVTESSIMESSIAAAAILNDLQSIGVRIAIDDFGTGYSSLAYLHRFPISLLKIDGSFIGESTGENRSGMEIARTIVALANGLGVGVLAEGVETEAQRDRLLAMGCRLMQGYLFSPPVPPDRIDEAIGRVYEV